ncbi:MAG: hypothetical protein JW936_00255 [Sedimentisphaerales bacterium]|nr:hypothetical protein [Sedimentisphaerales bacterium]
MPTIEIQGLTGAQHWIWIEAENTLFDSANSNAVPYWRDTFQVSGGNRNPDVVLEYYQTGGWVEFQFTPPADMTNTHMYIRYGASDAVNSSVLLDGVPQGTHIVNFTTTGWHVPGHLDMENPVTLGSLSRTSHIIRLEHPDVYCDRGYDAILFYEGPNADQTNGTLTFGPNVWGPYFMYSPSSTDSPLIGPAAKPVIVFHDRTAEEYEIRIRKDGGQWRNFVSGSVITEAGDYELMVYVTDGISYHLMGYAGANFSLSGVPGQCGSETNPIPLGDANDDCIVNLLDLSILNAQWLDCDDPQGPCP